MELEELKRIKNIEYESFELDSHITIGDFLKELLCRVWVENEEFKGKAPFGNSGWQWEIYHVLVDNGIVKGKLNQYEELEITNKKKKKADKIILDIIVETM